MLVCLCSFKTGFPGRQAPTGTNNCTDYNLLRGLRGPASTVNFGGLEVMRTRRIFGGEVLVEKRGKDGGGEGKVD